MRAAGLALLLGLAALIAGCATIIRLPTAIDADRAGKPLETLLEGRSLFVGHCGNCHRLPDPGSRDSAAWAKVLPEMVKDAELSPAQADQVLAFLQALATDSSQPDARAEQR